jgi:vacuolar-type H+-ATPase subunit F/Vma7
LGQIALLADRAASAYFRVTGIKKSYAVKDREDAEKVFKTIYSDETISLIMVTEPVMQWIQPILERTRKEFPLVVSIPAKGGPTAQVDVLAQLIKRTVGIELKVK